MNSTQETKLQQDDRIHDELHKDKFAFDLIKNKQKKRPCCDFLMKFCESTRQTSFVFIKLSIGALIKP